ncbi:MAG: hypothetical protein HWD59_15265 [Coxiellaceae bacterium]|nr:MAG: hypothetical protein HWD59_15265 [Coxiellaceae bacterium]
MSLYYDDDNLLIHSGYSDGRQVGRKYDANRQMIIYDDEEYAIQNQFNENGWQIQSNQQNKLDANQNSNTTYSGFNAAGLMHEQQVNYVNDKNGTYDLLTQSYYALESFERNKLGGYRYDKDGNQSDYAGWVIIMMPTLILMRWKVVKN